jgi:hypothetical protein
MPNALLAPDRNQSPAQDNYYYRQCIRKTPAILLVVKLLV